MSVCLCLYVTVFLYVCVCMCIGGSISVCDNLQADFIANFTENLFSFPFSVLTSHLINI